MLISDTAAQSEKFLRRVRDELETNELLKKDFGDLQFFHKDGKRIPTSKWSEDQFITTTGIIVERKGSGAKVRGSVEGSARPDLIICDDIENDENVKTKEQREKLRDWFDKAVVNALDSDYGVLWLVGTILHFDSLLNNKLKKGLPQNAAWFQLKMRAYHPEKNKVLWPERWSVEKLMARKVEIGTAAFNSEFQNNPIDEETQQFKPEWIKFYRERDIEGKNIVTFMGVDLAIGQKTIHDWFVSLTLGKCSETGNLYVRAYTRKKSTPRGQCTIVFNSFAKWEHNTIGIEVVAYQEAFKYLIDEESKKSGAYLPTRKIKQKTDKITRISGISPLVENGTLHFKKEQVELIDEMLEFPNGTHDDILDALEIAVRLARKEFKQKFSKQ